MKLAVLGGGGVRAPLLSKSILNRASELGLTNVVFMDNNLEKLRTYGQLAKHVAKIINPAVSVSITDDLVSAVRDADYVIATLRVGGDEGRVKDERIPLSMNLIGQETTGAGGFAMAMRSVPALIECCEAVKKYAKPGAAVFNFTNPSGLVAQALHDAGYDFVVGICDGPSEYIKALERLTDTPAGGLSVTCQGLNHFSFFTSVQRDGKELLPEILRDERLFTDTEMRFFDPALARSQGMLFNGYLYYYYHHERALANILSGGKTRGESIRDMNIAMAEELSSIDCERDFDRAMQVFLKYYYLRENSYMTLESGAARGKFEQARYEMDYTRTDNDGYAGVALNLIRAREGKKCRMVLSVQNRGSIPCLRDDDIVEITCDADASGIRPIKASGLRSMQEAQLIQMKQYERMASRAILNRDKSLAREALTIHPLVGSYSLARQLVDQYLAAHAPDVGDWHE